MDNQLLKAEIFGSGMLNKNNRYSKVTINHIPIMITNNDRILCIPDNSETTHIGFSAMTGKGKGIGGNTLLGFERWMKDKLCLVFNDFQQETFENSLPNQNAIFNQNIKLINVNPMPLPMVYVFPTNRSLIIGETEKKFPLIKMSIPTRHIIKNIENYYKLDKAKKYITANIDEFLDCRDEQEIKDVLESIIPEARRFEEMKFKIITVFKNIFDEMICGENLLDSYDYLKVKKRGMPEYHNLTIQSLLYCGFVPSIQTGEIRSKEWFSAYMSFILESIYEDKYKDWFLKDKTISLYVPEIDKMWKQETSSDGGRLIKNSLSLIGTNGRRAGIGLRWDTQNYDDVPDAIRNNTKYLFILRKSNEKEVAGIRKDFNITQEIQDAILNLETDASRGIFECVALTTDKFILYNLHDGSVTTTSEPQKGRLITPMAQHKTPGRQLSEVLGERK